AVAVPGTHDHRELVLRLKHGVARKYLQALNGRIVGTWLWRSCCDPVGEQVVFGRIDFDLEAAAVGQGERRLEQHETVGWFGFVDAPAADLPGKDIMVIARGKAAQRQLHTPLAGKRAMTRAGIAADLGQHRNDMVAKARLERHAGFLNLYLGSRLLLADD